MSPLKTLPSSETHTSGLARKWKLSAAFTAGRSRPLWVVALFLALTIVSLGTGLPTLEARTGSDDAEMSDAAFLRELDAAAALISDRDRHARLASLLRKEWRSRELRQRWLLTAAASFDSEAALADLLEAQADYFLGEETLRETLAAVAGDLSSPDARRRVSSLLEGRGRKSTEPTASGKGPTSRLALSFTPERTRAEVSDPSRDEGAVKEASLDSLIVALGSADPERRAAAAFELGRLGERATPAIDALVALLGDSTLLTRRPGVTSPWWGGAIDARDHTSPGEEAAKALLHVGLATEEALLRAAADPSWAGHARARWALGMLQDFD